MRHNILVFQICFLFSLIFSLNLHAQQAPVVWDYHFPLDIEPKVSGSFGEIRSNHFHSGVDLAIDGQSGWPVFSADTGFVSRVAVSPVGFGKALYIEHPSGYKTVYAHLDGFSAGIDSVVMDLQYRNESFSLQHYFKPGEIRVARGEIIGYSGNSGSSGGSHLHFEVRETEEQRPIDPLMFKTPVKDDTRPHIVGVKVFPLSKGATVNGGEEPYFFPAVFYDGAFHLKHNPRIQASGEIGVGVEVIDYYSGSWRKCGVHSINLELNGAPLYNYTMDGFYFRDTRYLNSHIDFSGKALTSRTIQKSFVDPYNKLDVYTVDRRRGKVAMRSGDIYKFSYSIKDISGNVSILEFNILGNELYTSQIIDQGNETQMIDASSEFYFEKNGHLVSFPEGSFYRDVPAVFEIRASVVSLSGTVFKVLDKTIPVHKWFEVKLPVPSSVSEEGLCGATCSDDGKLSYAEGDIEGTHFVIRTRDAGKFALMRDTLPPQVKMKNKPPNNQYAGRAVMEIEIRDDFSGIDQYKAHINGKWALFEYDAKTNRLICFLEKVSFLEKGKHLLTIEVTDRAGNTNKFETHFRY